MIRSIIAITLTGLFITSGFAQTSKEALKFDFGGKADKSYTAVNTSNVYTEASGFGFESIGDLTAIARKGKAVNDGFITSNKPFYFSVKLPEGNYKLRLTLGDKDGTSDNAIRVECRRMMVDRLTTKKGETQTVEFIVNVRDSLIHATGGKVHIKPREAEYLHWDNRLTIEFNGSQPKINALEIMPATREAITVFLAGNSTVVDQAGEPYAAWGQIIPSFFKGTNVAIANYAESGESLSSFIGAKRFEKILTLMKPGDYAFVEFGHNDQKQRGEGIGAFTSYKKDLKYFIAEVRKKGGIPVLITSMQRRSFDSSTGKINHTLGDYPDAVRQTAKEEGTALIDLNAQSKIMYETWGVNDSKKAFVIYPANSFPNQPTALNDNTHFNPYGAYEIARIIAAGIVSNKLGIAACLKKAFKSFDPSKPDRTSVLYWPISLSVSAKKPDGN